MFKHRTRDEIEFDDAFDERGQLRDGVTRVKVPLKLIDSAGRQPQGNSIHDAVAEYVRVRQLPDRKPGFTPTASLRTAWYNGMYDAYDAKIADQWKKNPSTGIGSHGPRGAQAGDVCTISGSPGHLRLVGGALKCVPDRRRSDTSTVDGDALRDLAYAVYDADLADAWRRAR